MQHATECGGSIAGRYGNCTGAKELEKWLLNGGAALLGIHFAKGVAGNAAHVGTALHYVMEQIFETDESPIDFVEDEIDIEEKDAKGNDVIITITDEMIGSKIIPALKWYDETLADADFWLEQQVAFPTAKLPNCWGSADMLFKHPVIGPGALDWKFGNNYVPPTATQFKFYLSAALHLDWFAKGHDKFTVFVAQPKTPTVGHSIVKGESHTYNRQELAEYEDELFVAYQQHKSLRALASDDPKVLQDPDYYTIGDHCKYCTIGDAGLCPAQRARMQKLIKPFKEKHAEAPPRTKVKDTALAVIEGVPSIAELFLEAKRVHAWADKILDFVKNEFKEGRTVPGLEQSVFRKELKWVDDGKALNWVRRQEMKDGEKIRADDYYGPRTLLPAAKIAKLLKDDIPEKIAAEVPTAYTVGPKIEEPVKKEKPATEFDRVTDLLG